MQTVQDPYKDFKITPGSNQDPFKDFKIPIPTPEKKEVKKTSILDTIGQVADVLNKPLLPESGTTRQQQSNFIELPGILGDAVGYLTGTGDRKIELPSLAGVYEEAIRPASSITGILTAALGGYEMAKSGTTMGQPTNFAQGIRQRNAQPVLNLPNKYADTTAANWGPEAANFGGMDRPILTKPTIERAGIERPILNTEAAVMAPHEKVAFENIAGQIKPSPIAEVIEKARTEPVKSSPIADAIAQQKKILAEQLKRASKEPESLLEAQQMAEDAFKDFKLPDSLFETKVPETTLQKSNTADAILNQHPFQMLEDAGVAQMNGEAVRARFGMDPKEALAKGLILRDDTNVNHVGYRVNGDIAKLYKEESNKPSLSEFIKSEEGSVSNPFARNTNVNEAEKRGVAAFPSKARNLYEITKELEQHSESAYPDGIMQRAEELINGYKTSGQARTDYVEVSSLIDRAKNADHAEFLQSIADSIKDKANQLNQKENEGFGVVRSLKGLGTEFFKDESGMARGAKPLPRVTPNETINKLMVSLMENSVRYNEQNKLRSIERAKRAAEAESVTTPGMKGHFEALSKLKGELPSIDYEGLKLTDPEVDSLVNNIRGSKHLLPYEKINAVTGLRKVLTGSEVPQPNEINVLREVFGDAFGQMLEAHAGIPVTREMVSNVANTMKALRASIDFSAPLRQGLPLIHKTEFWKSAVGMFPQAFSEEAFRAAQKELYDRPNYLVGKRAGLQLTDLGTKLSSREEAFGSTIAEKIPAIGPLVRGSERAYTGFLNKLRADVFDNLSQKARDVYGDDLNQSQLSDIARFVNNATGRGSLDFSREKLRGQGRGNFEKLGTELNTVFFSPRLISSRLRILGSPIEYAKADPLVRREALKSLFAIAGAGTIALGIGKMLGAEVSTNPVSSDFGKNKFGNTRVDPWGGFQQYVVAAARLLMGKDDSLSGKSYNLNNPGFAQPSRLSVLENFGKSKLSPLAGLGVTLASNKIDASDPLEQFVSAFLQPHDSLGKPIKLTREITDQFIPMLYSDIRDIFADDPNNLPAGIAGLFGMGLQTNQPSVKGGKKYLSLPNLPNIKIR